MSVQAVTMLLLTSIKEGIQQRQSYLSNPSLFWRVSQKSSNLGIRKGEPPVEWQRVKGISRPSQHASVHSQEVQFEDLTLHSTSCLDCDLTGMLFSKCVRLIFNTALVEMLNRACGLYGCVFLRALLPPLSAPCSQQSIYGLFQVIDAQVGLLLSLMLTFWVSTCSLTNRTIIISRLSACILKSDHSDSLIQLWHLYSASLCASFGS